MGHKLPALKGSFRYIDAVFPTLKSLNPEKKPAAETAGAASVVEGAPQISAEKPDFSKVAIEPLFTDYVDFETFQKCDFRAVKVKACEAVPKSDAPEPHGSEAFL